MCTTHIPGHRKLDLDGITCIKWLCLLQTLQLLNLFDKFTVEFYSQQHVSSFLSLFITCLCEFLLFSIFTWISILIDVGISCHGISKASRHVAGRPLTLQDLQNRRDVMEVELCVEPQMCQTLIQLQGNFKLF